MAEEEKEEEAETDKGDGDDKSVRGEEAEVEEVPSEGDKIGADDDGDNGN